MRRRLWTRTRVWRQAEVTVDAVRHENVQRIVLDENSAGGERGTLRLTVVRAVHLGALLSTGERTLDPFCVAALLTSGEGGMESQALGKTRVARRTLSPEWDADFEVSVEGGPRLGFMLVAKDFLYYLRN